MNKIHRRTVINLQTKAFIDWQAAFMSARRLVDLSDKIGIGNSTQNTLPRNVVGLCFIDIINSIWLPFTNWAIKLYDIHIRLYLHKNAYDLYTSYNCSDCIYNVSHGIFENKNRCYSLSSYRLSPFD